MKTALVIGGSRGIGAETVRRLSAEGIRTAFTYNLSHDAAQALADETGAWPIPCDARDEEATGKMAQEVLKAFRHLDVLVFNAGTSWTGLTQDMTSQEWDELFSLHVRGAFLAVHAFLPAMISTGKGSICFVSSMWGQVGASCETAYSACKAALIGFTKALAKEVGPSGIRVNCVAPGVIKTDMLRVYDEAALRELAEETPLMRLGTPEDIARAITFLCGDNASFITGQVLGVNGGFVI